MMFFAKNRSLAFSFMSQSRNINLQLAKTISNLIKAEIINSYKFKIGEWYVSVGLLILLASFYARI